MNKNHKVNLQDCKKCSDGSCCYEGAELTKKEMRQIIDINPNVSKPWFRLVKESEEPEDKYPFTTIMRDGTCVFQMDDNRCIIYKVRPKNCRNFPLENNKAAQYYERLCVLCSDKWPNNSVKRTYLHRKK